MKIIIMGCGRTGARVAGMMDGEGHEVTILDIDAHSFRRLPLGYRGKALVGNGVDQQFLKEAGIEQTDIFLAITQGDNRNLMASQIARHIFGVQRVITRLYDPLRQEIFATLDVETISPTTIFADIIKNKMEDPD